MAVGRSPDTVLYMVRSDGQIVPMTFYKEEKVIAFSRYITDGDFESVSVIHGTSEDEIWAVVKRNINGSDVRYIEYFTPRDFTYGQDSSDTRPYPYFFVDCGLTFDGGPAVTITNATQTKPVVVTYSGDDPTSGWYVRIQDVLGMTQLNNNGMLIANVNTTNKTFEVEIDGTGFTAYSNDPDGKPTGSFMRVVNSVSGADQLDGELVDICADGGMLPQQTVSAGALSFASYYNRISIGLNYKMTLQPMPLEINTMTGTSAGLQKMIEKIIARLYNTIGLKSGKDVDNLKEVAFGTTNELFTGDKEIEYMGDDSSQASIVLAHDYPLPCTILGLMVLMSVNDR
jgi:hypothetical protein